MQLVGVTLGRGAPFQVTHVRTFISNDERALKLSRFRRINAEVRTQVHWAAHALRDVAERTVGKDRAVQRGKEIVAVGHHRAEVPLHQLRMLAHRLAEGHEQNAMLRELFLIRGTNGHGINDGINGHAVHALLLTQRNAQLVVHLQQLGIDLVERRQRLYRRWGGVVARRLIVDGWVLHVAPVRLAHGEPATEGLQAPVEQPGRLPLFRRDETHRLLRETGRQGLRLEVGGEAVLILAIDQRLDGGTHACSCYSAERWRTTPYSHRPQPSFRCAPRTRGTPSSRSTNFASAAHASGKRSAISRTAQL